MATTKRRWTTVRWDGHAAADLNQLTPGWYTACREGVFGPFDSESATLTHLTGYRNCVWDHHAVQITDTPMLRRVADMPGGDLLARLRAATAAEHGQLVA